MLEPNKEQCGGGGDGDACGFEDRGKGFGELGFRVLGKIGGG